MARTGVIPVGVVRIPFEALRPLLAVVRQLLIVLQCHCAEVDRSIQTIGYIGVRKQFLVEVVKNAEKRRICNDVNVKLACISRSVSLSVFLGDRLKWK